MFRYIAILVLSIHAVKSHIDECYHENFDSPEQSAFSSACSFFDSPIWEFKSYGDGTLVAPPTSVSNGYIETQDGDSSCIANNSPLNVIPGSQIHVTYFATGPGTRLEIYLIFYGLTADVLILTPELNTWSTAILTSTTTGLRSFQLVAHTGSGSVSVDSVTYVQNADDYEACAFPDSEVPESPEVPDSPEQTEPPGVTGTTKEIADSSEEIIDTTTAKIPDPKSSSAFWTPAHSYALSAVSAILGITICLTLISIILRRFRRNLAAVPLCGQQTPGVYPVVQPLPKAHPPQYELAIPEHKTQIT